MTVVLTQHGIDEGLITTRVVSPARVHLVQSPQSTRGFDDETVFVTLKEVIWFALTLKILALPFRH
jgi:hypothetical protein